jgi:hypothetical protein
MGGGYPNSKREKGKTEGTKPISLLKIIHSSVTQRKSNQKTHRKTKHPSLLCKQASTGTKRGVLSLIAAR